MSPIILKETRLDLCHRFTDQGFQRGAEIGVWEGAFSEQLCRTIPNLQLVCVDPWHAYDAYGSEKKNNQARLDAAYQIASDRLLPFDCELLRMTSEAASALIPDGSLDFVYLDGNHAKPFIEADLVLWSPKVRSGGIVAGHDYELTERHARIQVKAAVDAFTGLHQIAPWYVLAAEKAPSYFWVQP